VLLAYTDEQQAYTALRHAINAFLALAEREREGRWPLAMLSCAEMLEGYLQAHPAEPLLLNYLAVCLYELNEVKVAKRLLDRALSLAPDTPHAQANLKEVERRLKKPVSAPFPAVIRAKLPLLKKQALEIAAQANPAEDLKISLCMIVKNEEADLPACLDSIEDWVDEMIVVDTGSTDATVKIAEDHGARVIHFPWTGSFAEARNVSLQAASGDWIIYLDADERLTADEGERFRALAGRTWREGIYLQETNFTGTEDSSGAQLHTALRLFRNRPWYRFEGAVHEQKLHTFPIDLPERFEVSDVRIEHHGYLKQVRWGKDKVRRNIELLEKQVAEQPNAFNLYNLGSEYSWLGDHARARPYFERSLAEAQKTPDWRNVSMYQFSPMLVVRLTEAIRSTEPEKLDEFIDQGLEWFPNHTDLVFERALGRYAKGDLKGTAEALEECIALGDADVRWGPIAGRGTFLAYVFLAEVQKQLKQNAAAAAGLRRCLEEWPSYTPALFNYTQLLLSNGQSPEEAEAELSSLPIDWSASTRMWVATAFYEAHHLLHAEKWYRLSLELAPRHATSLIGLGETLLSLHRYSEATEILSSFAPETPLAAAAYRSRAFALILLGQFDEAVRIAEDLKEMNEAEGGLYLAWLASREGKASHGLTVGEARFGFHVMEALLRLEEWESYDTLTPLVIAAAGEEPHWRRLLAELYERVGLDQLALEQWFRVCEIDPDSDSFYGLARGTVMTGMFSDARVFLLEALSRDPDHLKSKALLAQVDAHLTT
jgi:tetratricopeptide (TPR) repeat protein